MIEELRDRVQSILENMDSNSDDYTKIRLINIILSDPNCFFKLDVNDAFNILNDLGYTKEEAKEIYQNITSFSKYKELKNIKDDLV